MKRTSLLIIGGLSLTAFGYCSGRGCRSDPLPPLPSPVVQQPVSPLEHAVQQPPQQRTPQEVFLDFLASAPSLPPPPPLSTTQQRSSFTDDYRSFLKTINGCARHLYQTVRREAVYCYEEAKGYLQEKKGGK